MLNDVTIGTIIGTINLYQFTDQLFLTMPMQVFTNPKAKIPQAASRHSIPRSGQEISKFPFGNGKKKRISPKPHLFTFSLIKGFIAQYCPKLLKHVSRLLLILLTTLAFNYVCSTLNSTTTWRQMKKRVPGSSCLSSTGRGLPATAMKLFEWPQLIYLHALYALL